MKYDKNYKKLQNSSISAFLKLRRELSWEFCFSIGNFRNEEISKCVRQIRRQPWSAVKEEVLFGSFELKKKKMDFLEEQCLMQHDKMETVNMFDL